MIEKSGAVEKSVKIQEWEEGGKNLPAEVCIGEDADVQGYVKIKKAIKFDIKKIKEFFKPHKDNASKTLNDLRAEEKTLLLPREEVCRQIDAEVSKYELKRDMERKALEEAKLKEAEREEIDKRNALRDQVKDFEASGDLAQANLAREKIKTVISDPVFVEDENKAVITSFGNLNKKHDFDVFVTDERLAIQSILSGKAPLAAVTINVAPVKRFIKDSKLDLEMEIPAGFRVEKKIKY